MSKGKSRYAGIFPGHTDLQASHAKPNDWKKTRAQKRKEYLDEKARRDAMKQEALKNLTNPAKREGEQNVNPESNQS